MKNKPKAQLTDSQVEELFAYTERMHIKYKDVQFEIVDHMASGVEDTMSANKELTFSKALYDYAGILPMRFFNDLIEEKEKTLTSYWNRKFGKYLLGFLNIPRIIASIILFSALYALLPNINFSAFNLLIIFLIFLVIEAIWLYGNKDIVNLDENYLVMKTFKNAVLSMAFGLFMMPFCLILLEVDKVINLPWGYGLLSLAFTSLILFSYSVKYVFPKMLKAEIAAKYAHHNLKMA